MTDLSLGLRHAAADRSRLKRLGLYVQKPVHQLTCTVATDAYGLVDPKICYGLVDVQKPVHQLRLANFTPNTQAQHQNVSGTIDVQMGRVRYGRHGTRH